MKRTLIILLILLPFFGIAQENYDKILVGEHLISLQWISWNTFGSAKISKTETEGVYKITGIQESTDKKEYLKIDGQIKPISEKNLKFEGKIETKIQHHNQGNPCIRQGTYDFRVSGKRKYWRLKEKTNPCDKGNVVDYIDIYWKK